MTDKRIIWLRDSATRQRALDAVREAPEGWKVTVQPPGRTLDQNAALHARITEIAQSAEWCGMKHEPETWKRLLVGAWCRATGQPLTVLPALDGAGIELVPRRTSKLSQRECSELIEFINAWAAEHGY